MSKNHLLWPKAPGIPGRCCQAGDSEGSQGILQEPVEDEPFLWSVHVGAHPVCRATPSPPQTRKEAEPKSFPPCLSHPEGPSLLSVLSPARWAPLTRQRHCRRAIHARPVFSFESLSIVLIFGFDSPNFFPEFRAGKAFRPSCRPSRALRVKADESYRGAASLSLSLFSSAARMLGTGFRAHRSNFRSPISEVIIVFSFPLRWDREGRTWPWNPKVWIPVSAVGHAGCAALDMSLNPFTHVPSLVK